MLFEAHCTTGKLQVDETAIQVVMLFKKVVWSAPRSSVTRIIQKPNASFLAVDLTIYTTQGVYEVSTFAKRHLEKLLALFPGIEVGTPAREWYADTGRLTYVATYTDQNQMQRDIESAALNGWIVQSSTGTSNRWNRKITVTFGRTAEWLAQHR